MVPSSQSISSQLRHLIFYHLDNNLLQNALFLSERLAASERSAETNYLVSLCHLRLADYKSAYEHSRPPAITSKGVHLGCVYVFAQTCLALDRQQEGIQALERCKALWVGRNALSKHTPTRRDSSPDAAAVYCLLGKLHFAINEKRKAVSCFEEALKQNPFMWDAFTGLCDMGAHVKVANTFKINSALEELVRASSNFAEGHPHARDATLVATGPDQTQTRPSRPAQSSANDAGDPFNAPSRGFASGIFGAMGISQKVNECASWAHTPATGKAEMIETPTGPGVIGGGREPGVIMAFPLEPPQAPHRRNRTLNSNPGVDSEGPPKMGRSMAGVPRRMSSRMEAGTDEAVVISRASVLMNAAGERKRTVSGQVIQPRQPVQVEDPAAPQRRSVRISQITRQPSKAIPSYSSGSTLGARDGRDVKKSRPLISKIMRSGSGASTVGRVVSGNRKPVESHGNAEYDLKEHGHHSHQPHSTSQAPRSSQAVQQEQPGKQDSEAMQWLLDLFKKLGHGYSSMCSFQCQEALQTYTTIPSAQQNTPWVLAQMGRAYYEQASYSEAEAYYKKVHAMAPTRFLDMEIYSTILWHLKRETDLSFLAHELVDSDWTSPQAWCALGNAWSLSGDHEQALRSFRRATQLNPKFAYAFTLQGHEHVVNEEFDKALSAYRQAITADKRHYNAYYGIGRVFEKLGQYDKALQHFSAASSINSTNAVLVCWIGTVHEKQKNPQLAYDFFEHATRLAPRAHLARFKKARALMAMNDLDAALQELLILKDMAPDEPTIHFLLGRLYKALGEKGSAVRHFTIALNLDPKVSCRACGSLWVAADRQASQEVKKAIESLESDGRLDHDGDSVID
jgi:anaphase-promoting complex subunit 3